MKTLYVLRHAKAEPHGPRDHGRDLTERGLADARRIGEFLAGADEVPQLALVSDALRARRTFDVAAAAGAWNTVRDLVPAIYHAGPSELLELVRETAELPDSVLVVGHEPTLSETVSELVGGGRLHFPTAACARVDLDVERWRDVEWGRGELAWLVVPKLLR